jgi:hypothetical protein
MTKKKQIKELKRLLKGKDRDIAVRTNIYETRCKVWEEKVNDLNDLIAGKDWDIACYKEICEIQRKCISHLEKQRDNATDMYIALKIKYKDLKRRYYGAKKKAD